MVTPIGKSEVPTPAETMDTLIHAMNFKKPPVETRAMAGAHPVAADESAALLKLYRTVVATDVRQAVLDVLVAAEAAQGAEH